MSICTVGYTVIKICCHKQRTQVSHLKYKYCRPITPHKRDECCCISVTTNNERITAGISPFASTSRKFLQLFAWV